MIAAAVLARGAVSIFAGTFGSIAALVALDPNAAFKPLPGQQIMIAGANGIPLAAIGGVRKLERIGDDELPERLTEVVVAAEDRRFYRHIGFDVRAFGGAALADIRCRCLKRGASTIEAQLAKNSYLAGLSTAPRKFFEPFVAMALNMRLSKQQILARYLSAVSFGKGQVGLRAAARYYFDKEPAKLTRAEMVYLVSLLPSPSVYSRPGSTARRKRAGAVVEAMIQTGAITGPVARRRWMARREPTKPTALPSGSWIADFVATTQQPVIAAARERGHTTIHTTFDLDLQRYAQGSLGATARRFGRGIDGAVVVMRRDGRVLALVGGRSYPRGAQRVTNRALIGRPIGSTFKIVVADAALRTGTTLDTVVYDVPMAFGTWMPRNHDGMFEGAISFSDAFARSRNVPFIATAQAMGAAEIRRSAERLGLKFGGNALAGVLGTDDQSLLALATAAARIASDDLRVAPEVDNVVLVGERRRLATAATLCALMTQVVTDGTGTGAATAWPTWGKTGTTTGGRDALFVGGFGDIIIAVRVGRDDNRAVANLAGATVASAIFRDVASHAIAKEKAGWAQCGV